MKAEIIKKKLFEKKILLFPLCSLNKLRKKLKEKCLFLCCPMFFNFNFCFRVSVYQGSTVETITLKVLLILTIQARVTIETARWIDVEVKNIKI